MKSETKQLWIEALKSGNYKQGMGCLRHRDNFCCLGVLPDYHHATFDEIATWVKENL